MTFGLITGLYIDGNIASLNFFPKIKFGFVTKGNLALWQSQISGP